MNRTGTGSGSVGGSGIACPSDCSEAYPVNTDVVLTATPAADSLFTGWSGAVPGTCTGRIPPTTCTVTMDMSKTVIATFTLKAFTLTLNKGGNGAATVTSSPAGINCDVSCGTASATFDIGTSVTLTATGLFNTISWTGCDSVPQFDRCVVAMNADRTVDVFVVVIGEAPPGIASIPWTSELDVPDAAGQVVVNDTDAGHAGPGRSSGRARLRRGENRIELTLVRGAGRPGTWRLELPADQVQPGSLRVVGGDVMEITASSVRLRFDGRPGQRAALVFTPR